MDSDYVEPQHRQQMEREDSDAQLVAEYVSEWQVFQVLNKLRPTATGTDSLPAWYLKLGAPVFCGPLQNLFIPVDRYIYSAHAMEASRHLSRCQGYCSQSVKDYRPISVTPILTERTVVRHFLYPAFQTPPHNLTFPDQFTFRPTGSTSAALIQFMHTITSTLANNPYVIVIALDFSKAFDTVHHCTRWTNSTHLIMCTNGLSTISVDTCTVQRTAAPSLL